jgi:hypothetical protein
MGHTSASRASLRSNLGRVSGRRIVVGRSDTPLWRLGVIGSRPDPVGAGGAGARREKGRLMFPRWSPYACGSGTKTIQLQIPNQSISTEIAAATAMLILTAATDAPSWCSPHSGNTP